MPKVDREAFLEDLLAAAMSEDYLYAEKITDSRLGSYLRALRGPRSLAGKRAVVIPEYDE